MRMSTGLMPLFLGLCLCVEACVCVDAGGPWWGPGGVGPRGMSTEFAVLALLTVMCVYVQACVSALSCKVHTNARENAGNVECACVLGVCVSVDGAGSWSVEPGGSLPGCHTRPRVGTLSSRLRVWACAPLLVLMHGWGFNWTGGVDASTSVADRGSTRVRTGRDM